jgi:hypothetical protein
MRKRDLLDGLDDRSGPDQPPGPPDTGSVAWKLAWVAAGVIFFFVLVHLLG